MSDINFALLATNNFYLETKIFQLSVQHTYMYDVFMCYC